LPLVSHFRGISFLIALDKESLFWCRAKQGAAAPNIRQKRRDIPTLSALAAPATS
jgi:hypothetical protein